MGIEGLHVFLGFTVFEWHFYFNNFSVTEVEVVSGGYLPSREATR